MAFLAILYALRPDVVDLSKARTRSNKQNLEEAFCIAERELQIPRLLDADGESLSFANTGNKAGRLPGLRCGGQRSEVGPEDLLPLPPAPDDVTSVKWQHLDSFLHTGRKGAAIYGPKQNFDPNHQKETVDLEKNEDGCRFFPACRNESKCSDLLQCRRSSAVNQAPPALFIASDRRVVGEQQTSSEATSHISQIPSATSGASSSLGSSNLITQSLGRDPKYS